MQTQEKSPSDKVKELLDELREIPADKKLKQFYENYWKRLKENPKEGDDGY